MADRHFHLPVAQLQVHVLRRDLQPSARFLVAQGVEEVQAGAVMLRHSVQTSLLVDVHRQRAQLRLQIRQALAHDVIHELRLHRAQLAILVLVLVITVRGLDLILLTGSLPLSSDNFHTNPLVLLP